MRSAPIGPSLATLTLLTRTDCMNTRIGRDWHRLQRAASSSSQLYFQLCCAARRPQPDLITRRGPDWSCPDAVPGLPLYKTARLGLAKRLGAQRETVKLSTHARPPCAGSLAAQRFRRTPRLPLLPSQPRCPP